MFLPFIAVAQSLIGSPKLSSDKDTFVEKEESSAARVTADSSGNRDEDLEVGISGDDGSAGYLPDVGEEHASEDSDLEADETHRLSDFNDDFDNDDGAAPLNRRSRRALTSNSQATTLSGTIVGLRSPPTWYLKLKQFLDPAPAHQGLESYIPSYRYTPIISGVVIPFAILLEIPGLTQHWYIRTLQNQIVETQANSVILDVGMAFSMLFGLLACFCLIVRFLERRVKTMTTACIIFLTMHDIINITALTIFGVQHRFDDGFTYGQSFWMTVCSTAASTLTNITLIVDFIRTPEFANSGSGLTRKQRSLVIMVIILLSYVTLGALVHTYLLHLTFIDALYFTVVTIETVGLGDITPKSRGARAFVCFYALFGVLNVALAVGLTRETVIESLEIGYRKRVNAVSERRRKLHFQRRVQLRWREAVSWRLREGGHVVWVNDETDSGRNKRVGDWLQHWWPGAGRSVGFRADSQQTSNSRLPLRGTRLNIEALSDSQLEAAAMEAGVPLASLLPPNFRRRRSRTGSQNEKDGGVAPIEGKVGDVDKGVSLTHARLGRMIAMLGNFALAVQGSGRLSGDIPPDERLRQTINERQLLGVSQKSLAQQWNNVRGVVEEEERKAFFARLIVAWLLFLVFYLAGSAVFVATEGWNFGSAMYFCFMAFMTIGYGDFTPDTPAGRSIFVAWALLAIPTMTILISVLTDGYSYQFKHAMHRGPFEQAVMRYRKETAKQVAKNTGSQETAEILKKRTPEDPGHDRPETEGSASGATSVSPSASPSSSAANASTPHHVTARAIEEKVRARLETLPHQILEHARTFHERMQYFVGSHGRDSSDNEVPPDVMKLMDDIAGAETLGERIKQEILHDDDARHTLFALSIEEALRQMIKVSEEALEALKERDKMEALVRQKNSQSILEVPR